MGSSTGQKLNAPPAPLSFTYSLDWLDERALASRGQHDRLPPFPAAVDDPLSLLYETLRLLFQKAAADQSEWWPKPQKFAPGRLILEHESRHDAFVATWRMCIWARLVWKYAAERNGFSWSGAADCLGELADRLARGNPKLSADEVLELISHAPLAKGPASAYFPRRAFASALEYYSRHYALPKGAVKALNTVRKEMLGNDIFAAGVRKIDDTIARCHARSAEEVGSSIKSFKDAERVLSAYVASPRYDDDAHAACVRDVLSAPERLRGRILALTIVEACQLAGVDPHGASGVSIRVRRLEALVMALIRAGVVLERDDDFIVTIEVLSRLSSGQLYQHPVVAFVTSLLEQQLGSTPPGEKLAVAIASLADAVGRCGNASEQRMAARLAALLRESRGGPVEAGEAWSDAVLADIAAMAAAERTGWLRLHAHCRAAGGSARSRKWIQTAGELLSKLGDENFAARVLPWFALVDRGRTAPMEYYTRAGDPEAPLMTDQNADVLKGLCWIAGLVHSPDMARTLGRVAFSCYRKVPGVGPRAVKVGNAAVYALGQMPGMDAVGQLAMLRVKVKFGTAQKGIEKALAAAAAREQLPREEMDELGLPSYGLTDVGMRMDEMGEYEARLEVTGIGSTELTFVRREGKGAGKVQKSVPAAVKSGFTEELKDLKAAAKDVAAMLPAQRDRIDSLFLENKSWAFDLWRVRYLDHPLVGVIARRLIWRVSDAKGNAARSVMWVRGTDGAAGGGLVDVHGKRAEINEASAVVRLWHPIEVERDEVLAWRRFIEDRQIRQPFKQAHREVYVLTDVERATGTYSNRFAAHVLRQHQFNALCGVRGWKNKLRLLVDDEYPPAHRAIPAWSLRAEYWIEGVGDDWGTDTNEAGTFLYLATDQVRFYRMDAAQATAHAAGGDCEPAWNVAGIEQGLPLEEIPPLVFSEIMRDVDLFVGVSSVANNPQWSDGGPDGVHRNYWWQTSFGDLSETGAGRKDLLERLLPRLKIADVCSLAGKFLRVRGKLREYKIHLGSGNILMEPNDEYLCIVPSSRDRAAGEGVFLPFEGDRVLAIILSKALMLAEDDRIKDPSIVSQIGKGG